MHQASPGRKDIVTSQVTYDAAGRPDKTYLPTPVTGNLGGIEPNHPAQAITFYGDNAPFAQPVYEASPLNRVERQFGAGSAWRTANRAPGVEHLVAGAEVRRWTATPGLGLTAGTLTSTGPYSAGELYKTQTTDEDNNLVVEYTDKQGRVVQKNVQDGGTAASPSWLVTTYVYDGFYRLAFVIQPQLFEAKIKSGPATVSLSDQADAALLFAYRYDARGRLIEKLVPGGGWTHLVYNRNDQPVLTQNARQQASGQWSFTKYDVAGRAVLSGDLATGDSRTQLQEAADAAPAGLESRSSAAGNVFGYNNASYPSVSEAQVTLVQYYDDYDWDRAGLDFVAFGGLTRQPARGLPTGSKARLLTPGGQGTMLTSALFYDAKSRLVQTQQQNPFGGVTRTDLALNFAGEVLTKTDHYRYADGKPGYQAVTAYEYDQVGRLLRTRHGVGPLDQPVAEENLIVLAEYVYDEVGRLKQKRLQPGAYRTNQPVRSPDEIVRNAPLTVNTTDRAGKITLQNGFSIPGGITYVAEPKPLEYGTTEALQVIDYGYNVRGWLTGINGGGLTANENDLFGMSLAYQEGGVFNGNITRQSWLSFSAKDAPARSYAYTYDPASRITGASYAGGKHAGENYSLSGMSYDKNGNIKTLTRRGMSGDTLSAPLYNNTNVGTNAVDQLTYTYANSGNSNRLATVADAVKGNLEVGDFRDPVTTGDDYGYYADGSLSSDKNKDIGTVVYNSLGLVQSLEINKVVNGMPVTHKLEYLYDGSGRKWQKRMYNGATQQNHYNYYDQGIQFETNPAAGTSHALSFLLHQEGRVITDPQSGQLAYEYHYRDHLGNLRVAFRQQTPNASQAALSFEPQQAAAEEAAFERVSLSRSAGVAFEGRYAARLQKEIGPGKTVQLQEGETLKASVFVHFEQEKKKKTRWLPLPVLDQEENSFEGGRRKRLVLRSGLVLPLKIAGKGRALPKAYLQVVVRDTAGKIVHREVRKLSRAAAGWQELTLGYKAQGEETAEVSLVNGSNQAAYFDNLTLVQEPPLIVQENLYDPWGLNLAGTEQRGNPDHKYQYNGKEKQEELGLNWLDYGARMYDSQLGRWHVTDPLADGYESWTPYNYVLGNPISITDPFGMDTLHVNNITNDLWKDFDVNADVIQLNAVTVSAGGGSGNGSSTNATLDILQGTLDVIGMVPGASTVAGVFNAGIDVYRGNYGSATFNLVTSIPGVGTGLKIAAASTKVAKVLLASKAVKASIALVGARYNQWTKTDGYQVHHIIPQALQKRFGADFAAAGFDIHEVGNLRYLEKVFHTKHDAYTRYVAGRLDEIITNNGALTVTEIRGVISHMHTLIDSAEQTFRATGRSLNNTAKSW
jgi:RHS repeat-associated protein